MKIKEYKNKIVLAELDPKADYIMLFNPDLVHSEDLRNLEAPSGVYILLLPVHDVDKSIRFVEIPKKKLKENI